jgi:pimeloyl-ACP methyl ester carboxylesterase
MKPRIIAIILLSIGLLFSGCRTLQNTSDQNSRIKAHIIKDEKESIRKGWQQIIIKINGLDRKILWKGPGNSWQHGAIIALHGGGGTYSNFGSTVPIAQPMVEFGKLAINQGFAVFSLESTWGVALDEKGRSIGKRWDCMALDFRENIDLPFIQSVITEVIPKIRPSKSAESIFITGISNGGYMTILAATHFSDKIDAFAPVSTGDPYGTFIDLGTHPRLERQHAPGVFRDNETNRLISERRAAVADSYPNEKDWPATNIKPKPQFKQFQHKGDGLVDISCMEKAQKLLTKHGYRDDGPFILIDTGGKSIWNHFWMNEYNRPMLEFFIRSKKQK